MSQRTVQLSEKKALADRRWLLVDAEDKVLGRLATQVAGLLRGKGKASFTPYLDCGDFVVVVNAAKVRLTGKKDETKIYVRHTGFPGGVRRASAAAVRATHPERMIADAVAGMLPKNRLASALLTKLKVYAGAEHPHVAQNPQPIAVGE